MTHNEQHIRNAIVLQRFSGIMAFVKGTAVALASAYGVYLELNNDGKNINTTNGLYKALGPEGMHLLVLALCVAACLFGLCWAYTGIRDLTAGMRQSKEETLDYTNTRPYDM